MSIFHKRHDQPYRYENSIRGVIAAARAGGGRRWDEIDLDVNMSKDGVIVNTHWTRPLLHDAFIDPQHHIDRHATVASLTWAELHRLHSPEGYRINTLETMLTICAEHHIGARIEPKADHRFEDARVWATVKADADAKRCRVRGYSIRNLGGPGAGVRRVRAMNAGGIPSNVIR